MIYIWCFLIVGELKPALLSFVIAVQVSLILLLICSELLSSSFIILPRYLMDWWFINIIWNLKKALKFKNFFSIFSKKFNYFFKFCCTLSLSLLIFKSIIYKISNITSRNIERLFHSEQLRIFDLTELFINFLGYFEMNKVSNNEIGKK